MNALEFAQAIIAGFTLAALTATVVARRMIHAGFSLMAVFMGVAAWFAAVGGGLLAVSQILIYVGGVLLFLLFGVMLSQRSLDDRGPVTPRGNRLLGAAASLGLAAGLYRAFAPVIAGAVPAQTSAGVADVGREMLTRGVFLFEILSVYLLVALIGAAYLSRRGAPEPFEPA